MKLELIPIEHVPDVQPGMNLPEVLSVAIRDSGITLKPKDVVAIGQKVVSKAEGRVVALSSIEPSPQAAAIARRMKKNARVVEVVLRETKRIVRMKGDVLICETHHGFICANAGVDQSNTGNDDIVTLLPKDPDQSARDAAQVLGCGVIITDTFGRVWREGLVDTAIGLARVPPFVDFRGQNDAYGRPLQATLLAAADSLAAAAGLVMGKSSRTPAVVIRGFEWEESRSAATMMLRPAERDLFL